LSVTSSFGAKPCFFEQLAHQLQRRALVSAALNKHIEDLAFVIHGALQIHPSTVDPNHHLVEMPSVARAWAALPQTIGPNFSTQRRTVS
jgi:hypothetical protein